MSNRAAPKMPKWPFFAADLLLLGLALWIVNRQPHPLAAVPLSLMVGAVVAAAFLGVWPYRLEYATSEKLAESGQLASTVEEIKKLESVGGQIRAATGQWQTVQEHSAKTITAAKEIGDRMAAEAKAFADFMEKANDSEKAHLRLEVEKMRRGETEWLHTVIRLLDHVYALQQAGVRSGQRNLVQQLTSFQDSCRDIVRRVGLTPVEAIAGETFEAIKHQLMDGEPQPPDGSLIEDTLATGYSFQGQLLRRTLVNLQKPAAGQAQVVTSADESTDPSIEQFSDSADVAENPSAGDAAPEPAAGEVAKESIEQTEEESFRLESESLLSGDGDERRSA